MILPIAFYATFNAGEHEPDGGKLLGIAEIKNKKSWKK